jgi:predicted nucleic acid-binding protein
MLYVDTGVLTKWYLPEADSVEALALRDRFSPPAFLTSLHRLELANAWQLKIFRDESAADAVALAREDLATDIRAGLWHAPVEPLAAVYSRAESLAQRHSASLGTRSMDILHVAAAEHLDCSHFITGDRRQARLAEAIGLPLSFHQASE